MNNQPKAVIFDLDGVLIDTGSYHEQSFRDLAALYGLNMSDTFFIDTFGMQNRQSLPILAGRSLTDSETQELSDWKEQRYRELIAGKMTLLAGVRDLLNDLKKNGYRTAIGTSTPRKNVEFMMDNTHVQDLFDAYTCSEEVQKSKPAPDTFLSAASKLGVPPEQCLVIEDAIVGVEAGLNAGMRVLAVTTTRTREELARAHRIIDSLTEITSADIETMIFG